MVRWVDDRQQTFASLIGDRKLVEVRLLSREGE
jgi:hypothetical protein